MPDKDLLKRYNYDSFVPDNFNQWMQFHNSPPLGQTAPDFPLWQLEDRREVMLSDVWGANLYTIVEFGSFT